MKLSPFHSAIRNGDTQAVRDFISLGADINERTSVLKLTSLHVAIYYGREEIFKILLDKGGKKLINEPDAQQNAPLHAAVIKSMNIVQQLVAAGANVHVKNKQGATPLDLVMNSSRICHSTMRILIYAGADVNTANVKLGYVPLHCATMENEVELMQFLLQRGADVNAKTTAGQTSLHYAAIGNCGNSRWEAMYTLLAHGAKVTVDQLGFEPYDYLNKVNDNCQEICEWFRRHNDMTDDDHDVEVEGDDTHDNVEVREEDARDDVEVREDDAHDEVEVIKDDAHDDVAVRENDVHDEVEVTEDNAPNDVEVREDDTHDVVVVREDNTHDEVEVTGDTTQDEVEVTEDTAHDDVEVKENDTHYDVKVREDDAHDNVVVRENDTDDEVEVTEDDAHDNVAVRENDARNDVEVTEDDTYDDVEVREDGGKNQDNRLGEKLLAGSPVIQQNFKHSRRIIFSVGLSALFVCVGIAIAYAVKDKL